MNPLLLAQNGAAPLPGFIPGTDGKPHGELMLDLVFLAMFLIVPLLGASVLLVKYRRKFVLHKWLQIGMGVVLLAAVTAFEIDMRVFGWRHLVEGSPFYVAGQWNLVLYSLAVHLCFAVPTPLFWIFVIVQALRKIPNPPRPCPYSPSHIFWARIAAIEMVLTAVTGWVFYVLAFMIR